MSSSGRRVSNSGIIQGAANIQERLLPLVSKMNFLFPNMELLTANPAKRGISGSRLRIALVRLTRLLRRATRFVPHQKKRLL
jgi:hypothetical protein